MDNYEIPSVDPVWDYTTAYEYGTKSKEQLSELISYMSSLEKADEQSDQYLFENLNYVIARLQACCNNLSFHSSNKTEN